MGIMDRIGRVVQQLLNEWAREAAEETGVIRRQREFTAETLSQTFVLGHLADPHASDAELAGTAAQCGVNVTAQGVGNRFSPKLIDFLEALFRRAIREVVVSDKIPAALLKRFPAVLLLDSTTITLPAELAERFSGCGGSHGFGKAALKLQVQFDLRSGALQAVAVESGRDCDYKTPLQRAPLLRGSLRIADLGYFDTDVYASLSAHDVSWLSRLQFGTSVFTTTGQSLPLLSWLNEQPPGIVDRPILLHSERRISCRLIAWRIPEEQAHLRRQKLIAEAQRKSGRMPTQERLAWCDWQIFVTNVPVELLSPQEVTVLYRARWQIELLFKRWKSLGCIAELTGPTLTRQLVRLWARLIAVIVQHWILLTNVWGDSRLSLTRGSAALRKLAVMITPVLNNLRRLVQALHIIAKSLQATARCNPRKHANTFELLQNPSRLEWVLP